MVGAESQPVGFNDYFSIYLDVFLRPALAIKLLFSSFIRKVVSKETKIRIDIVVINVAWL